MPKTHGGLWPRIASFGALHSAFLAASRGKRYMPEVLAFKFRLEENLLDILRRLGSGTWTPGPWSMFRVWEPKERVIHAPSFSDRVVHHALVGAVEPLFERRFIADSFACRRGKGMHAASARLSEMLRRAEGGWFLKADVSKYFPSVDLDVLLDIVRRTVADERALALLGRCLHGFPGPGLPIGALTSQLMANVYLDAFDHYVKDVLRVKRYVRYMDDFIIAGYEKRELWDALAECRAFLESRLRLRLNGKTGIAPLSHGVDFCGYRHWATHVLPRRRVVAKAKRTFRALSRKYALGLVSLEDVRPVAASFAGYMKRCSGRRTAESAFAKLVLRRYP